MISTLGGGQTGARAVDVRGVKVGMGQALAVIAGPCSVESLEGTLEIARAVKQAGAKMLRGGAYKPRTSPYAFQGVGKEGLEWLRLAGEECGLPVVSEITAIERLDEFLRCVDLIQVGARNMQNFELLKALGRAAKPVLLKRGYANTIEELIMSAEYLAAGGNGNVILCERGIRTFETYTRNSLDLSVIAIVRQRSDLPIIVDPSHATGDWSLVEPAALAAVAAGADGLMIEVHCRPEAALSDGAQSLKPGRFDRLMLKAHKVAQAVGRRV